MSWGATWRWSGMLAWLLPLATACSDSGGGTLTATQVQTLRSATQRVMCLAGSSYTEAFCALF